jgi:hypothetical protein
MSNTLDKDGIFKIFLPASVVKAGKDKDGKRWIQGIASTSHKDLQNEYVMQDGLDFSYFLKHGHLNNDHKQGPENIVGEPTDAKITKDGLWIKGFLFKGKENADYWWEHINSLEQSGSNRKVGFSVEGKVKKKVGAKIVECWIKNVAITASPVNTHTWAEIAKSLSGSELIEGEDEEKALSAGSAAGQSLVPESLEGSAKIQTYKSLADVPQDMSLSQDEYVTILQLEHGWSKATAKAVTDAIFIEKGIGKVK